MVDGARRGTDSDEGCVHVTVYGVKTLFHPKAGGLVRIPLTFRNHVRRGVAKRLRIVLIAPLLALSALVLSGCSGERSETPQSADSQPWLLVNFWSEWCAPCRKEIPVLNALQPELARDNVRLVGVNFDDSPVDESQRIAHALGIEFPTLSPREIRDLNLRPPDVMPTTYLLNPDHGVAAKLIGVQSREGILTTISQYGPGARVAP